MATDAVILVESLRDDEKNPEYLIFVRGGKFESAWSLAKALEEFCGNNTRGFEMSYYAGISPEEFETQFTDKFSRVNILFARSPEELAMLKEKFGIDAKDLPEGLLENDWVEPKKSSPAPIRDYDRPHSYHEGNAFGKSEEWRLGWGLVIFLIIAALIGTICLLISYTIKRICWTLNSLVKKLRYNKNRQGT